MIEWTDIHARLYDKYLRMRQLGRIPSEEIYRLDAADREISYRGQKRLRHLVPEYAPTQEALARLLAEVALLSHKDDFRIGAVADKDIAAEAEKLRRLIGDRPGHAALIDALAPYVERIESTREAKAIRDNRIGFAVWVTLEADIRATRRFGATTVSAASIVTSVLHDTGLSDIGEDSVNSIWRDRAAAKRKRARSGALA